MDTRTWEMGVSGEEHVQGGQRNSGADVGLMPLMKSCRMPFSECWARLSSDQGHRQDCFLPLGAEGDQFPHLL